MAKMHWSSYLKDVYKRQFMYCGISTTIWGLLFGGFFGDAITVVSNVFFHKNIELKALWFVPLNDPMRLLMYSMVIGIIHMFLGLGIKGYMLLKDNKIVDFICDVLLWYSLLIGLILLLLPTDLFASISQMTFVFPVWLTIPVSYTHLDVYKRQN